MKTIAFCLPVCVVLLFVTGCGKSNEAKLDSRLKSATPQVSEIFSGQLLKYLEEGAKMSLLIEKQIDTKEYNLEKIQPQWDAVKAAFELAKLTRPINFASNAFEKFQEANTAWEFAVASILTRNKELAERKETKMKNDSDLFLYQHCILDVKHFPIEPDINGYKILADFARDKLYYRTFDSNYPIKSVRGKKHLFPHENAETLARIANDQFKIGRDEVLKAIN